MIGTAQISEEEQRTDTSRRDTFLRLIEQYHPALHRLASAYVTSAEDIEDLVQEIATALWQAIASFRGDSSERTWLYRVAHNTAITASLRVRRRSRREFTLDAAPEPSTPAATDEQFIRRQRRDWMLAAIRELALPDRQLVSLHLEGLSHAEISEIAGLSEGAVATRLSRIRSRLAHDIQKKEAGR